MHKDGHLIVYVSYRPADVRLKTSVIVFLPQKLQNTSHANPTPLLEETDHAPGLGVDVHVVEARPSRQPGNGHYVAADRCRWGKQRCQVLQTDNTRSQTGQGCSLR
jgi:hypothetical protein